METDEKAKRKNEDKAKGRPPRGLSPRAAFMLVLLAALLMGLVIVVVLKTTSSPAPYPADRLVYNSGTSRNALDLRIGDVTVLGAADEGRDVLSPDGQWWARWVVDGELGDSWVELKSVVTGEKTFPLKERFYGTGVRVTWWPDSQWIVFHGVTALAASDDKQELWRVNIKTGALEQLTHNTMMDRDPDVSPDGTQLVYTSRTEDRTQLVVLTLATATVRRLGYEGYAPRWSPDGLWIVFALHDYEVGPLMIMRADTTGAQTVVQEAWWWNFGWER